MGDDGVDDDDDKDGGRDVDFAPSQNCKFSILAMAAAAENARIEDDSNNNRSIGASDDRVIDAGGKFCGVRIYDECDDDGRIVGAFGTFLQHPHVPTNASFSLLAAIAADGGIRDDDDAYLNEDHDGTLTMCTSRVQVIDNNIENICHNDKSNNHLIDAVLGENCDGSFNEVFTNGLGLSIVSRGHNHRGVLETPKRKASFLATWSGPSAILQSLPFIWQRLRKGCVYYFADVFLVVTIIANALQFGSASAYVKCRGWTLHKRGTMNKLQYRKLEQVFDQCAPNGCAALLAKHIQAMAKEIYSVLNDRLLQHVYEAGAAIRFLKMESFLAKLHQYSQDYQIGLIVCNTFFMVAVPNYRDDPKYWMKKIFASCCKRNDYVTFCHNSFVIFPNDAGDPVLAKCLIMDCVSDEVHRRASSKIHQMTYGEQVEASLR
jgi:hypothetical protein